MNERTVRMVQLLSRSTEPTSLGRLASMLGVSERTVRSDVAELNHVLHELSLGQVGLGPRGVVEVPPGFSEVEKILPIAAVPAYRASAEERGLLGAAVLAAAPGYLTTAGLADLLSVSRVTAMGDLTRVRAELEGRGLALESRPGRGIRATGAESARRAFLVELLDGGSAVAGMWRSLPCNDGFVAVCPEVRSLVDERCRRHGVELPDGPFRIAETTLALAAMRTAEGCVLEPLGDEFRGCPRTRAGDFERALVADASARLGVDLPADEALLLAALAQTYRFRPDGDWGEADVDGLVRTLVARVSSDLGVDLTVDGELLRGLAQHVAARLRAATPLPEGHAVFEGVIEERPEVFAAVRDAVGPLERAAGRRLTRAEMASVGVHVCAALERLRAQCPPSRVIVVCDLGTGAMQLLVEEVRSHFGVELVGTMFAHDVELLQGGEADLVVSTVPLPGCPDEVVVVQPLMGDEDYAALRRALDDVRSRSLGR